jgi:hypothetical protein
LSGGEEERTNFLWSSLDVPDRSRQLLLDHNDESRPDKLLGSEHDVVWFGVGAVGEGLLDEAFPDSAKNDGSLQTKRNGKGREGVSDEVKPTWAGRWVKGTKDEQLFWIGSDDLLSCQRDDLLEGDGEDVRPVDRSKWGVSIKQDEG